MPRATGRRTPSSGGGCRRSGWPPSRTPTRPYWTGFLRALAEIDPDMAVNIEHEDASYSRLDGLALAAENLRAAAAAM
jgi:hypothetical protein